MPVAGDGSDGKLKVGDTSKQSDKTHSPASISDPQNETVSSNEVSSSLRPITEKYALAAADSAWWFRKLENKAFGVGERLRFAVKYGMLPAGTAVMEISEIVEFDGFSCYRIV